MAPRTARLLLVGLAALAVLAVVVARRTPSTAVAPAVAPRIAGDLDVLGGPAPPVAASGWLNSPPLSVADLAGKVVLYDFWTFGCSNCRATLPYVEAWHERYAADGLVVIGIHTPEFSYEADPEAVAAFVQEHGLHYPIALDPDRRTWRAFANRYWPAFYLHDAQGNRRYVHAGEGRYDETEDAIRALLGVAADAPRAEVAT